MENTHLLQSRFFRLPSVLQINIVNFLMDDLLSVLMINKRWLDSIQRLLRRFYRLDLAGFQADSQTILQKATQKLMIVMKKDASKHLSLVLRLKLQVSHVQKSNYTEGN